VRTIEGPVGNIVFMWFVKFKSPVVITIVTIVTNGLFFIYSGAGIMFERCILYSPRASRKRYER